MPQYQVAMVQFRENGRLYPANCASETVKVGDMVLVFMNHENPSYTQAKIAKIDENSWSKPCKNSIVAAGDEIKTFVSALSVKTKDDLEVYLCSLGFAKYEVFYRDNFEESMGRCDYIYSMNLNRRANTDVIPYQVIVGFRAENVFLGYISYDDNQPIWAKTGRVLRTENGKIIYTCLPNMSWKESIGDVALIVQSKLAIVDLDPNGEPTNWAAKMRDQIGDGSGGPVYLGDGIYI